MKKKLLKARIAQLERQLAVAVAKANERVPSWSAGNKPEDKTKAQAIRELDIPVSVRDIPLGKSADVSSESEWNKRCDAVINTLLDKSFKSLPKTVNYHIVHGFIMAVDIRHANKASSSFTYRKLCDMIEQAIPFARNARDLRYLIRHQALHILFGEYKLNGDDVKLLEGSLQRLENMGVSYAG